MRLCLLFLPNVPGAMFIQGGTFIPDSRVVLLLTSNLTNELRLNQFLEPKTTVANKSLKTDANGAH